MPYKIPSTRVPRSRIGGAAGRAARLEHRIRPARQNDAARLEPLHERDVLAPLRGMDLAVDARLPNAARDELRELRAAIEDEDPIHALYHVVGSAVSPRNRSSSVSRCRAT